MLTSIKLWIFIMAVFTIGWLPLHYYARGELKRHIGPKFVVAYGLTLMAGLVAPSAFFFFAAMAVIFLATVRTGTEAVCRYILMVGLTPFVFWPIAVGSAYITTVDTVAVLGLVTLFATMILKMPRAAPFRWTAEFSAIIAIYLVTLAGDRSPSVTIVMRNIVTNGFLILLPYAVIRSGVRNHEGIWSVIACLAATAVFLALYAAAEVRFNWAILAEVSRHLGDSTAISMSLTRRGRFLRATGPMSGALMLGTYTVMAIIALLCSGRFFKKRWAHQAAVAASFVGLLATQSRGSLLAIAMILFIAAVLLRKWLWASLMGFGAVVGGLALAVLMKSSFTVASFLNTGGTDAGAGGVYDYRQLLLHRGLQEGFRHPIFGDDLKRVLDNLSDIVQGQHIVDMVNVYLSFFLTGGLVGLAAIVICMVWALTKALRKPRRSRDHQLKLLQVFAVGSLLAAAFELSFMSLIDRLPFVLAVSLVTVGAYTRARKAPNRPAGGVEFAPVDDLSKFVLRAPQVARGHTKAVL